jgi:hypothetical protein
MRGRCEQAQSTGALDGLGSAVPVELGVQTDSSPAISGADRWVGR